ncbi:DUF159-domain-containing protein [Aspergillus californicus]
MCGRYALGVRMYFVRNRLQEQGMPVDEAPDDDQLRETYNFAPGNIGAIYRADNDTHARQAEVEGEAQHDKETEPTNSFDPTGTEAETEIETGAPKETEPSLADNKYKYKLQPMKWGLIPFWTKRQPDYGSLMRTINCRDDSLIEDKGMWTSMKRRKRCVVVCQGYYEWMKRGPGGRDKIPYYTRRKDSDLMYFAGLWDCVEYQGSEEKLHTFTVITTSAKQSLSFLHDRMPVIIEPGSEAWKIWLDPTRTSWSKELQGVLKPYEGDLECYQVPKEVGKVGNDSPSFIVPVDSKENKSNIANFFANAKEKTDSKREDIAGTGADTQPKEDESTREASGLKRGIPDDTENKVEEDAKKQKTRPMTESSVPKKQMRSATYNQKPLKKVEPKKATDGTQRITNFFSK